MDLQDERGDRDQEVLIPDVQGTIPFHDKLLIAVRLPNGEHGVVLRWICENLHIATNGQIERIKRTEVIADGLVYARIQTEGGPQVMPTLLLSAVPYWLATIDIRRMDKDDPRRQEILDYQRKAVEALYTWAQSIKDVSSKALLVPSEPVVEPVAPGKGAPITEWKAYHDQMSAFLDWQMNVETWRETTDTRLGNLESVTTRILKQIGPPRITLEQQTLVQYYVSHLSKITKKDPATIYAALKTAFRVPRYQELLEADWPKIEQWFKKQFPHQNLPLTQSSWIDPVDP